MRIFKIVLTIGFILTNLSVAIAGQSTLNYDASGRISSYSDADGGVIYEYDEVGNTIKRSNYLPNSLAPVITSVIPSTFLLNQKVRVKITGQNLMNTKQISTLNSKFDIGKSTVSSENITVDVTAKAAGNEKIVLVSDFGSTSYDVLVENSQLVLSPSQLAIPVGGSGTLTASIIPSLSHSAEIVITPSNPIVATIEGPVVVPANGSAIVTVVGKRKGSTLLDTSTEVFIEDFRGLSFAKTAIGVSVGFDIPQLQSEIRVSQPVSIGFGISPTANRSSASKPVSMRISQLPTGTVSGVSQAVSVSFDLAPINTLFNSTRPVSVSIDQQYPNTRVGFAKPVSLGFSPPPLGSYSLMSKPISMSISAQ